MSGRMKLLSLSVGLFGSILVLPLAADESADVLWKKVETAIDGVKKPAHPVKTREEAFDNFKKAIAEFDAAEAAFLAQAPADPRRWDAALFDAEVSRSREIVGIPAKVDASARLNEILNAPDADPKIKGDASAALVLEGAARLEEGSTKIDEWTRLAEKHLQSYPDHPRNASITSTMRAQKAMAEFKSAPLDLKFTAIDGHEVDLSKMRGKVVLIDFWATWCGPCVAELPNVLKAYEALHSKGFEIVGISLDQDRAKLDSFIKEKKMTWPQFFDGQGWKNEISSKFGIRSIPAMWLIDKNGMLVSTNVRGRLEEEISKRLAE
jgi:thiol-disulfide isomerase/thioredoxin